MTTIPCGPYMSITSIGSVRESALCELPIWHKTAASPNMWSPCIWVTNIFLILDSLTAEERWICNCNAILMVVVKLMLDHIPECSRRNQITKCLIHVERICSLHHGLTLERRMQSPRMSNSYHIYLGRKNSGHREHSAARLLFPSPTIVFWVLVQSQNMIVLKYYLNEGDACQF